VLPAHRKVIMAIDVVEVKRRLGALLNDANLVNEYIRQFGPSIDIKNIKAIKEAKAKSIMTPDEGVGDDPIFEINVICPVCGREGIVCFELRAKSQQILKNKFLVPSYEGASGFKTVDYSYLSVSVCSRCLFASPDKKDWNRPEGNTKSQVPSNVIMTLQERIGERRTLLKSVSDTEGYFKRPRSKDAAVDSYQLAISRAHVEAFYEQPYALYKLGAYSLRIAKILKDAGADNREMLREALGYYEEAFRTSNCASEEIEMQVIYSIVALCLKLEDPKKANSYIGVFGNLHNDRVIEMKNNPKLNLILIDKWTEKAKQLWEDRDRADLFKDE
jgi:uncharacterized protein (DUF2225 family)